MCLSHVLRVSIVYCESLFGSVESAVGRRSPVVAPCTSPPPDAAALAFFLAATCICSVHARSLWVRVRWWHPCLAVWFNVGVAHCCRCALTNLLAALAVAVVCSFCKQNIPHVINPMRLPNHHCIAAGPSGVVVVTARFLS